MGNITATGMTINSPNNVHGSITINSGNTNESSIRYKNQAQNKEYIVGYGTYSHDGFGIYSVETDKNVFKTDKYGNTNITGNLDVGGLLTFGDGHRIWVGTEVLVFSNGEATWDITAFGLQSHPLCLVLTCNNTNLAMQYDYDNSSATAVKIRLSNTWNGAIRFSYVMTT